MEKLNNENNVSRETSKEEVKIVFKKSFMDIISTRRMEINDMDTDLEKVISYATDISRIYAQEVYFVIYNSDGLAVYMSDVSREISKNEIKIIFKKADYEIIAIHRKETDELKNALEKTISYITQLLEIYDKDGFAVIYVNDRLYGIVDLKDLCFVVEQL